MGISFQTTATISESFRDILKKQQYEEVVLAIMNRSQVMFKEKPITRVENQSNSEPDFLDCKGNKYDVKLLIDKKQGSLIGEKKNDIKQWIQSMLDESAEFNAYIQRRGNFDLNKTKLYDIMKERIGSLQDDEIGILFCPYPIVNDSRECVFLQFATDYLQAVYNKLVEDEVVKCKDIFFLYPSMEEGVLCVRNGNTRAREFVEAPEICKHIGFETVPSFDY